MSRDIIVNPYYIEARNEILRPDRGIPCSEYFLIRWAPRLGATATVLVLYLRQMGKETRSGEARVQITQKEIADALACSVRTLQRELAENAHLGRFVRREENYVRGDHGHVRQMENVYYIAMDDPLTEEDEERLAAAVALRAAPRREGKIIHRAEDVVRQNDVQRGTDVVRQNDALRDPALCDKMTHQNRYDKLSHLDSETIRNQIHNNGNVSETRSGDPKRNEDIPLEAWRKETEELARYSADELGDRNSLGYHIQVWNHARKSDRLRSGPQEITRGVFAILTALSERRKATGRGQGSAWTRRTRQWFEEKQCPLLVKADRAEQRAVQALLADAPFLQDDPD